MLNRAGLVVGLVALSSFLSLGLRGQDRQPLRDALIIEEAMQRVIHDAEPSIACILVSHSDAYRKLFHEQPTPEYEGKLGGFVLGRPLPAPGQPIVAEDNDRLLDDFQKYDLSNPNSVPESYGSGVVIDADKLLILTNYHVVRDATKIFVRLPGEKGSYADIHAADELSDLAVLKLLDEHVRPLKAIKFGDAGSVRKGQFVVTLSNPFAAGFRDGSPSASWGIISNIRLRATPRRIREDEDERSALLDSRSRLLQTDARLNIGCSGGAMLNLHGEMIGLTTAKAALVGTETPGGFAYPIDSNVKRIIERLRQGMEVEYGFLGVGTGAPITIGGKTGIPVTRVLSGSPASKAGLQLNEAVLSINGVGLHDHEELSTMIGLLLAGSEARLEVRDRTEAIVVKLVKTWVPGKVIVSNKSPLVHGFRVDYTSVLSTQNHLLRFSRNDILPGVYVREVQSGSAAESAGLRMSDIIVEVNGHEVNTPAEFYREVQKAPISAPLALTLAVSEWSRTTLTKLVIP